MTNTGVATTRPPLGLAIGSLLRADSIVMLNSRTSLFLSTLLPVAVLVVTTFGKAQSRLGGSTLLIGLALTLGLLTSCLLGYTLALAHDRDVGVLQRLQVTPAPNWMIITSRLIVQVATNLIASVIVVVVGAIAHGLTLDVSQYVLVLAVAVLGAAVFLSIGQALVGLVQSTSAISAIGRLLMILLILLGTLGGSGILGDTIKTIADWSPVGALMTLFSDVLNQSAWSGQDASSLLASFAYIIVFAFIGIRWFRWNAR
ncbi:ABC transporter permease [Arthrobacter sp. MA-N2]|uniref:ABC transporter permease n=1 Tax=Arthrobacter sp. MA-N2 TaxID=1101188 RepID=UPI000489EE18|nr:ABC transporter permease [Arthrobacter sp. MA-N2]